MTHLPAKPSSAALKVQPGEDFDVAVCRVAFLLWFESAQTRDCDFYNTHSQNPVKAGCLKMAARILRGEEVFA
jgi:hypothetical protein